MKEVEPDEPEPEMDLPELYDILLKGVGPQHWWPGETDFEVIVGAILVQQAAWRNVEMAILNLKAKELMTPTALAGANLSELEVLIKPSGYFRQKAKRLIEVTQKLINCFGPDLAGLFKMDTIPMRNALLSLNGIGPETADSIVLYAGRKPKFVVDAYTYRILTRVGLWTEGIYDYHALQSYFEDALPPDVALYNEFHALLVALGNQLCKPKPKCDRCPLTNSCKRIGL